MTELSPGFRVLRLVSTADSRTERLCVPLPVSIRPSLYLIQLSLLPRQLPNENKNRSQRVASFEYSSHTQMNSKKRVAAASY